MKLPFGLTRGSGLSPAITEEVTAPSASPKVYQPANRLVSTPGSSALPVTLAAVLDKTRGYYNNRYQSAWEVERYRRVTQVSGYGNALVNIPVNAAVGEKGWDVKFKNPTHQRMWDAWRWNPRRPWEDISEALRDAGRAIVRDGEVMAEMSYQNKAISMLMVDPLDCPMTGGGVRLGAMGEPVEYWVRPYIGNDPRLVPIQSHFVSAMNFVHVFPEEYARQTRGISWMRPAIDRVEELEDLLTTSYATIKKSLALRGIIRISKSWGVEPQTDDEGNPVDDEGNLLSEAEVQEYAEARMTEALTVAPDRLATVYADEKEIEYMELVIPAAATTRIQRHSANGPVHHSAVCGLVLFQFDWGCVQCQLLFSEVRVVGGQAYNCSTSTAFGGVFV